MKSNTRRLPCNWFFPPGIVLLLLLSAAPVLGATSWGPLNPTNRQITAQVGNRSIVFRMPFPNFPNGQAQSCTGSGGTYQCSVTGAGTFTYQLTVTPAGDSLFVEIESNANVFDRVTPLRVITNGGWGRVDIGQYGMAIGQVVEKAGYCRNCQLWTSAFWDPTVSQGTRWNPGNLEGNYQAGNGSGNMKLTQTVLYDENLDGVRLPVREKLEIRVAETLWGAVPSHPNQPSSFAQDLVNTIFVDIWSQNTAIDLTHLVQILNRIAGDESNFYTNWASWGAAGHDGLTPDSIWMNHDPPYPPNTSGFGSLEKMQAFAAVATASGYGSFRTYYSKIEEISPSYLDGLVRKRLDHNGEEEERPKLIDIPTVAQRQEQEISDFFGTNALYTDTMGGAYPQNLRDYDPLIAEGLSMSATTESRKVLGDLLKAIHGGPLAGESLQFSHVLGEWVATGQFDLWNGHHRRMTPEYKLRRLHHLSTFHGLGISKRFSDRREDWNESNWRLPEHQDDYRAMELLFGNGAYLYIADQLNSAPWANYLTEVLIVGQLQRYYALQEVSNIEYHLPNGTWKTLEALVEEDHFDMIFNSGWIMGVPAPQSEEFERIRVTYSNGFQVVVNRSETNFSIQADGTLPLTLPPFGWAVWNDNLEVLAYSGWTVGANHRVDFLEDHLAGVSYVDPRGGLFQGDDGRRADRITQWHKRNDRWEVRLLADLEGDVPTVSIDGQLFPLYPTQIPAATTLATDFTQGLQGQQGWRTLGGVLTATELLDGVSLDIQTADPRLITSNLNIDADAVDIFSVEMFFETPPSGSLSATMFFKREGDPHYDGSRAVTTSVAAQSGWQTVTFHMNSNALWAGSNIVQIRFDPLNGVANLPMTIKLGQITEGLSQ